MAWTYRRGKGIYQFPVVNMKFHLWELTNEVNNAGYLVLRHHTLATLEFRNIQEFRMEDFNHQNAVFGLSIEQHERTEGPSPYFSVDIPPAFGVSSSFKCLEIEVVDAQPCSPAGDPAPK